jgi:hypothetical protein
MTNEERLAAIDKKLDKMIIWQAAHAEAHRRIEGDVEELRATIYGNGRSGLKQEFTAHAQRCRDRTCPSPIQKAALGVAEKVIAGGVLALIAWLLLVYRDVN